MDSIPSSSDVSSGKAASLASGILSSLNALLGSNAAGASAFAGLLAEEQAQPPAPAPSQTNTSASTQNNTPQVSNGDDTDQSSNATSSSGTLTSLLGSLHRILNKLSNQNGSADHSSTSVTSANSGTGTPGTTAASTAAATTASNAASQTSTTSGTDSSTTAASGSSPDDSDASDSSPLTSLFSDLTSLMKLMEKKLEAAQAGTSGDATQASGNTSDTTSAADPLAQLLALMQSLQKELVTASGNALTGGSTSDGGTASATSTAASPAAGALQDLLQLQKDLKGLMASLEGSTGGDSSGSNSSSASGANTVAATGNLLKTPDQTSSGKTPLAAADSIFNLFSNTASNYNAAPATPTFSTANVIADNSGLASDTSSDTPTHNGNTSWASDGNSSDLNSLNANTNTPLSGLGDSTKSVDPYSFASQLSATRAANGGTTGLPDAVEQVLLQINRGVKDGNDQMTIQLHPAELGKINVRLDISADGQVRGTVVADNPSTLNMLHKDSRSLERALQEAGLRADPGSLQFSMSGQSNNTSGQAGNNSSSGNASSGNTESSETSGTLVDVSAADEIYYVTPGRVNLKV